MPFSTRNSVIAHLYRWDTVASLKKKINRLHERCLRIIYGDKHSSFEELLEKVSSVSVYERKIQILAAEMYKVSRGMSPPHLNELFKGRNAHPYNLKHNTEFLQLFVNSVHNETECISCLCPNT